MSSFCEGIAYVPCDVLDANGIPCLDGMSSGWANDMSFNAPPVTSFGLSNNHEALAQSSTSQGTLESATVLSSPAESQTELPVEERNSNDHVSYADQFEAPATLSQGQGVHHSGGQQLDENHRLLAAEDDHTHTAPASPAGDESEGISFVQSQLDPTLAGSQGLASAAGHVFQGQQPGEFYFVPINYAQRYGTGQASYHSPRLIHDAASAYNSHDGRSPPGSSDQHGESPSNNGYIVYQASDSDDSHPVPTHDQPLIFMEPDAPDFVPKMSEILNADHNNADTSTLFPSAEHANQFEHENLPDDVTAPRSIQQQRAVVRALFNAIKSTDNAQDNPGMIKPFLEGKYSDRRIEILCWNIMHTCAVRHTRGSLLAPFELKRKQTTEMNTYAERMSKIIECLMTQKTICKHLLDPYYLFQFIDDPVASQKRVVANKNLNKRKGHIMNAGKKIFSKSSPASSPQTKLEDSFVSETPSSVGPIHGLTSSSNLGDPDRTITPDGSGSFMENLGARNLGSSTTSSPSARRVSVNMGVTGATPYHMPHHFSQPMSSHNSSPSPVPKSGGSFVHHLQRFHNRRISGSLPRSRAEGPHTPSHSRNVSADSSVAANSFVFDGTEHHPMIPSGTPTGRPRSDYTNTASSGRKRTFSEVDETERSSSPEKKQREDKRRD